MDFEEFYPETCSSVSAATRIGNVEKLKSLLQEGKASNLQDNRGWRALHHAAFLGHVECMKILLKASDVDVNAITFERQTALNLVCSSNLEPTFRTSVAKILLEAGADPNVENKNQYVNILNGAILTNCLSLVKLLLDYKVNVNELDDRHGSALNVVAETGSLEILQLILKQKLILNPSIKGSCTFFHIVIHYFEENGNLLKYFLKKPECLAQINCQDERGTTPLLKACIHCCCKEAVGLLLDYGADPNIRNGIGSLPLNAAAESLPDDDLNEEDDSLFIRLYKLTCNRELRRSRMVVNSSLFFSVVATGNKKKMLSFILKEEKTFNQNSFTMPLFTMATYVDDLLFELYGEGDFELSALALWCANLEREKDFDVFLMLLKDVEDINDTSNLKISPICAAAAREEEFGKSFDADRFNIIYYLLKEGANVSLRVTQTFSETVLREFEKVKGLLDEFGSWKDEKYFRYPYWDIGVVDLMLLGSDDPLPSLFMMASFQQTTTCLEFLLIHSVPAETIFDEASLIELKEYYEGCIALQGQRLFSLVGPRYIRSQYFTSRVLQLLMSINKFLRQLPPGTSELLLFLDEIEYERMMAKNRDQSVNDDDSDSSERARNKQDHFSELYKTTLKALRDVMETPKPLKHLASLRVRFALWESRKTVLISTSVRDLCAELKLPSSIEKLLMLGMDSECERNSKSCFSS